MPDAATLEFAKAEYLSLIKSMAPWWHDIDLPAPLGGSTHALCGIDQRVLLTHPHPLRYPRGFLDAIPCDDVREKRVLEIGPASGFYTLALARRGNTVIAVEQAPRFLAQIALMAHLHGLENRISLVAGTWPDVAVAGDPPDVAWCLGVAYHIIRNGDAFIAALGRTGAQTVFVEIMVRREAVPEPSPLVAGMSNAAGAWILAEEEVTPLFRNAMDGYRLADRVDFKDSDNGFYNQQPFYRSVLRLDRAAG